MNKKLLALAVASVLAAPATALAQVTISGVFKVGIDQYKISNTARTGNTNEMRITDNSSRIIFSVTEDLGGGLAAIGQWDVRSAMDSGSAMATSGNTWVGLRSSSWGSLTLGRHDLHYGKQPDDTAAKAGALMAAAVSLMDFVGGGGTAIAVTSRTANVVKWDSPSWGGFTLTAAYGMAGSVAATGAAANEGDLGGAEKGNMWNLNPAFTASNWQIGASLYHSAQEATGAEQEGQVVYGYMRFGGWKIGAAYNSSSVSNAAGADTSDRNAWTIPASFTTGAHNFYVHYTKADDDDIMPGDESAKMWAFAYVYDLSKRTSMGVTVTKLDNGPQAAYNFFTNTGALGSTNSTLTAGEDGQLIAFTVRHAF